MITSQPEPMSTQESTLKSDKNLERATKNYKEAISGENCKKVRNCFNNLQNFEHPLTHELMGTGYGEYQNYLISQFPKCAELKIPVTKVIPINEKEMEPIKSELESLMANQEEEILNFFKDKPKHLINLRFNPIECLLIDPLTCTIDKNECRTGEEPIKEAKELNDMIDLHDIKFLKSLKELAITVFYHCQQYVKKTKKSSDPSATFLKNWNEYMKGVMELNIYFQPIADVINNVSEKLFQIEDAPKFTIYRVLIGIFISYYFRQFTNELYKSFNIKLRELTMYILRFYTLKYANNISTRGEELRENPFDNKLIRADFLACFGGKNLSLSLISDTTFNFSQYLYSLLDMHLNERNAHYICLPKFLDINERNKTFEMIEDSLNVIFKDAYNEIKENKYMKLFEQELIGQLVGQYRMIFPPCFLLPIEMIVQNRRIHEIKKKLKEYNEMTIKQLNELKGDEKSKPKITAFISDNEYKEELENFVESNVKKGGINQAIFYLCRELPKVIRGYLRELDRNSEAEFNNQTGIQKNKKLQGNLTPQINA